MLVIFHILDMSSVRQNRGQHRSHAKGHSAGIRANRTISAGRVSALIRYYFME
jgi:hypothetical protein